MAKHHSRCKQCGRPDSEAGHISKRGMCNDCGTANQESVNRQLAAKSGPAYNLWLKRSSAANAEYVRRLQAGIDKQARLLDQQLPPAQ